MCQLRKLNIPPSIHKVPASNSLRRPIALTFFVIILSTSSRIPLQSPKLISDQFHPRTCGYSQLGTGKRG